MPATPSATGTPTATARSLPTSPPPTALLTPGPTMPPAADVAAELTTSGALTVCLAVMGAPASGLDESGNLVGYNVSFAEELAHRLHLGLDTRSPLFDDLITTVEAHDCDIAISSQNITAARQQRVDFVAYTKSIQPVLVAAGNPSAIAKLDDLCGKRVSATTGTTHVDLVRGEGDYAGQGLNAACVASARRVIDLRTFDTEGEAITALLDGTVDAYLGNPSYATEYPTQVWQSDALLPPARQGITIARDHPGLLTAIQAALNAMFLDGTYRAILIQNLPNDASVRVVSIID